MLNFLNKGFKIESVKTFNDNKVSFCPKRGGIITSIKFKGKEILYFDKETFQNLKMNVRGGIPILFPNFGPIESLDFPGLKQHGFARDSSKWITIKNQNSFKEVLISDSESKKSYPYNFKLTVSGKFEEDNSITLKQEVENLDANKELPISMGLHPYFKVQDIEKRNIKFNCEDGKYIEDQVEPWSNGNDIYINNPNTLIKVTLPKIGILTIKASPEYKKIWIWSLPEKDFICIEPVMREKGGLVNNPKIIKPKAIFSASINISLNEIF
jgi:D-hexose-6-phosphate mutarotase